MKSIDVINSRLKQIDDSFEKLVLNSIVDGIKVLYQPTKDEEYNTRHMAECLIVSSLVHLQLIEAFNQSNFQKSKEFIYQELIGFLRHSEPIPLKNGYQGLLFFDESEFMLTFFDKYEIISREISNYGRNRNYFPAKFLKIVYDDPLNLNINEIEYTEGNQSNNGEKINQSKKFIDLINQLKTDFIPTLIKNQRTMENQPF